MTTNDKRAGLFDYIVASVDRETGYLKLNIGELMTHIDQYCEQEIAEARVDEINRMRKAMVEHSTPAIYHMERIEALKEQTK